MACDGLAVIKLLGNTEWPVDGWSAHGSDPLCRSQTLGLIKIGSLQRTPSDIR
jgi:hypothetical protein